MVGDATAPKGFHLDQQEVHNQGYWGGNNKFIISLFWADERRRTYIAYMSTWQSPLPLKSDGAILELISFISPLPGFY
jgi:hypothetical protein